MKIVVRIVIAGALLFALMQLVRPRIPARVATAELQAPPEIEQILARHCYSCHSDERRLAWFDEIEPAYWLVRRDILTAREHLNFSTLGAKPAAAQKASLYEAVNMIQLGAMPLPRFVALHPEGKVAPQELAALKAYLAPWTPPAETAQENANSQGGAPASEARPAPVVLDHIAEEPNGLDFDPSFESWRPISTTDRGDNNTFRFILGNEIAVKAAASGNFDPWPDGTRFAKIAWQQEPGRDGLLHPGKFVQVEMMVKDANRYRRSEGWVWGRWRGLDLKPYGSNANFQGECMTCHLPVRGSDYVYTLPITRAEVKNRSACNNPAAALPAGLPYQPLGWRTITMYVDPRTLTTATLYGNDQAMQAVNLRSEAPASRYPAGAVLALVTWAQRDDPHWFGARIPATPMSVEFVESPGSEDRARYRSFAGAGFEEQRSNAEVSKQRIGFILGLTPAQLP